MKTLKIQLIDDGQYITVTCNGKIDCRFVYGSNPAGPGNRDEAMIEAKCAAFNLMQFQRELGNTPELLPTINPADSTIHISLPPTQTEDRQYTTLAEFVQDNTSFGELQIDPAEVAAIRQAKAGEVVRVNGSVGCFTDIRREQ